MKLKKCKYCGSDPKGPTWSPVTQMRIGEFQDVDIMCSHCYASVDMTLNVIDLETGKSYIYEKMIIDLWNKIMLERTSDEIEKM